MRLSEAIRLGSMASEQCRFKLEDENGRRCALGAALFAIGCKPWISLVHTKWPWLGSNFQPKLSAPPWPHEGSTRLPVHYIIMCLNDLDCWSRERIANWVATIEPPQAETAQQPQAPKTEVERVGSV